MNYTSARYYPQQWHLHPHFLNDEVNANASANCEAAWHYLNGYGCTETVIAVIDDGCRIDLSALNCLNTIRSWGYIEHNKFYHSAQPGADAKKMFSVNMLHGTSICTLIAANAEKMQTVGVAPNTGLIPLRWPAGINGQIDITEKDFLIFLDFISDKADIVLCNWSKIPIWKWSETTTDRIKSFAISGGRRNKGLLFICAAGNSNCPINFESGTAIPYHTGLTFDLDRPQWQMLTAGKFYNCLVGLENTMHVAGLASTGQRAHYSCYGPGIDVCAPANNYHTYRRLSVKGLGITTLSGLSDDHVTHRFKGTSAAAAIVAGVAALILSSNSDLTAAELKIIMRKSASKDLDFTPYPKTPAVFFDTDTSWDVSPVKPFDDPQFDHAGWSPWFGFGKIDALAAVKLAKTYRQLKDNFS